MLELSPRGPPDAGRALAVAVGAAVTAAVGEGVGEFVTAATVIVTGVTGHVSVAARMSSQSGTVPVTVELPVKPALAVNTNVAEVATEP